MTWWACLKKCPVDFDEVCRKVARVERVRCVCVGGNANIHQLCILHMLNLPLVAEMYIDAFPSAGNRSCPMF